MNNQNILLSIQGIVKTFLTPHGWIFGHKKKVYALSGVSFEIKKGETLGLVGESGCGKSTLGRCILGLIKPTKGSVFFRDQNITQLNFRQFHHFRREMQIVFQDPYSSLNPRRTIQQTLIEPLEIYYKNYSKKDKLDKIVQLLDWCGLSIESLNRYPHEFSGGQRQRICIARALILEPQFVVCDEPVSALDVSIQSQIIYLMQSLQEKLSLTYLFISHDLRVIRKVSHRVAVMYLGQIVELASITDLYSFPQHPYTKALFAAVPMLQFTDHIRKKRKINIEIEGEAPSPISLPLGCKFHPRCPHSRPICEQISPILKEVKGHKDHIVACHYPNNLR